MLDIYHKALLIDKSELESFANKYSHFLIYFKEINGVLLKMPIAKAALLNADGIIKIDDKVHQFTPNSLKIIENGAEDQIKLLDKIEETNENITVHRISDASEKVFNPLTSGIYNHQGQSIYQAAWIHYFDFVLAPVQSPNCDPSEACKSLHVGMGTVVGTYFLGQPHVVPILNIGTTASIGGCDMTYSDSDVFLGTNTDVGFTNIIFTSACINLLQVNQVGGPFINTTFGVLYANGVNFIVSV